MEQNVRTLLAHVRARLDQAGAEVIPMPDLEARELTACALGVDRRLLPALGAQPVRQEAWQQAEDLTDRRLGGEPLAYVLGEWDFYGITLRVTPDVLIPRSDTERLCELAIERVHGQTAPQVLDLCSGSGCIALALLHEVRAAQAIAVDLSPDAVAVANDNAARLGLQDRYQCVIGSALEPPPAAYCDRFDLMVCNPPYITAEEMGELDHDVADFEPHLALYGGPDGLDFYRTIMKTWRYAVKPGGQLLFECGWKQGEDVAAICRQAGLTDVQVETDYAGVPRIVCAVRG